MKFFALLVVAALLSACGSLSGTKCQTINGGFSCGESVKPIVREREPSPLDPGYRLGNDGRPTRILTDK